MARNRLYMLATRPPYEIGEWYDNVPDPEYVALIAAGDALPVTHGAACNCWLADGRAVSLSPDCATHAANPLRTLEDDRKAERLS